jgi:EAL and modified HD-GYP domain-containing signal transduction protein
MAGWKAPRNVFLEVGQAELDDAERVRLLFEAQRHGVRMALRLDGTPAPDQHRLQLFQYVIAGPGMVLPRLAAGTVLSADPACAADADAAFARGAHAVLGWPVLAPVEARALEPLQRSVLDMIRLAQSDADLPVLERGFRADPILAFMLLTLANSPAFVRVKKISSLTQAIMVLGYARLVKWLVLMLVIASKDGRSVPIIYTAVVRGFLIEQAAAASGQSREAQDDGFMVGAFSLLQVICGQTAEQLFAQVELPDPIRAALIDGTGPHGPALALARAFETHDEKAIRAACATMGLTWAAANATLLHALSATDALQGVV